MNCEKISKHISKWIENKVEESRQKGLVVGVSGGIDSAVVSTLCARTRFPVIVLSMPIHQVQTQVNNAMEQIHWLKKNYSNVTDYEVNLTHAFEEFKRSLPENAKAELAMVNTRSRIRMAALYAFANSNNALVCGTGNKIEDYGVGFFTKYGDGGVDMNPIGDLLKSEVYELAAYLDVPKSIQQAKPTDGLWEEDRTDEDQIGATYDEIEWAMKYCYENKIEKFNFFEFKEKMNERQLKVLEIYLKRHNNNLHKMEMPPVCVLTGLKE